MGMGVEVGEFDEVAKRLADQIVGDIATAVPTRSRFNLGVERNLFDAFDGPFSQGAPLDASALSSKVLPQFKVDLQRFPEYSFSDSQMKSILEGSYTTYLTELNSRGRAYLDNLKRTSASSAPPASALGSYGPEVIEKVFSDFLSTKAVDGFYSVMKMERAPTIDALQVTRTLAERNVNEAAQFAERFAVQPHLPAVGIEAESVERYMDTVLTGIEPPTLRAMDAGAADDVLSAVIPPTTIFNPALGEFRPPSQQGPALRDTQLLTTLTDWIAEARPNPASPEILATFAAFEEQEPIVLEDMSHYLNKLLASAESQRAKLRLEGPQRTAFAGLLAGNAVTEIPTLTNFLNTRTPETTPQFARRFLENAATINVLESSNTMAMLEPRDVTSLAFAVDSLRSPDYPKFRESIERVLLRGETIAPSDFTLPFPAADLPVADISDVQADALAVIQTIRRSAEQAGLYTPLPHPGRRLQSRTLIPTLSGIVGDIAVQNSARSLVSQAALSTGQRAPLSERNVLDPLPLDTPTLLPPSGFSGSSFFQTDGSNLLGGLDSFLDGDMSVSHNVVPLNDGGLSGLFHPQQQRNSDNLQVALSDFFGPPPRVYSVASPLLSTREVTQMVNMRLKPPLGMADDPAGPSHLSDFKFEGERAKIAQYVDYFLHEARRQRDDLMRTIPESDMTSRSVFRNWYYYRVRGETTGLVNYLSVPANLPSSPENLRTSLLGRLKVLRKESVEFIQGDHNQYRYMFFDVLRGQEQHINPREIPFNNVLP